MKFLISIILFSCQLVFAGTGSGTLPMGGSVRQIQIDSNGQGTLGALHGGSSGSGTLSAHTSGQGTMTKIKGIVLYQGEAGNDVYFKYGQAERGQWKIDQFKMEKNSNTEIDTSVAEALLRSKISRKWQPLVQPIGARSAYDSAKQGLYENDK